MNEYDTIEEILEPVTLESLVQDLYALGGSPGMVVITHSSLSALGWVCGGPVTVVHALIETLGQGGTLVMPTHSSDYSDPAFWQHPPVPQGWWDTIRDTMPAFNPDLTPTRNMGSIAETFRRHPAARRSVHPELSFAAMGPARDEIVDGHTLEYPMGEGSPLARLYDQDAYILLLGVGHANNTSLHLAEYRSIHAYQNDIERAGPVMLNGKREWVTYQDIQTDPDDFERIGAAYERESKKVRIGRVGAATARLMPVREVVDFAVKWMDRFRPQTDKCG